jgi:hypothetical protein
MADTDAALKSGKKGSGKSGSTAGGQAKSKRAGAGNQSYKNTTKPNYGPAGF